MFTYSFPPLDDLIHILSQIEYKKHFQTFINACIFAAAFIVAIVTIIVQRCTQWYANGGKNDLQKVYKNVQQICSICILWVRIEGYPFAVKFYQNLMQTYRAWSDLMTV